MPAFGSLESRGTKASTAFAKEFMQLGGMESLFALWYHVFGAFGFETACGRLFG